MWGPIFNLALSLFITLLTLLAFIKQNSLSIRTILGYTKSFLIGIGLSLVPILVYSLWDKNLGDYHAVIIPDSLFKMIFTKYIFESLILIGYLVASLKWRKNTDNIINENFITGIAFFTMINILIGMKVPNLWISILYIALNASTHLLNAVCNEQVAFKIRHMKHDEDNTTKMIYIMMAVSFVVMLIPTALFIITCDPALKPILHIVGTLIGLCFVIGLYVIISFIMLDKLNKKAKEVESKPLIDWSSTIEDLDDNLCPNCRAALSAPYTYCYGCHTEINIEEIKKHFLESLLQEPKFVAADKFIKYHVPMMCKTGCYVIVQFTGLPDLKYQNYDKVHIDHSDNMFDEALHYITTETPTGWGCYLYFVECSTTEIEETYNRLNKKFTKS